VKNKGQTKLPVVKKIYSDNITIILINMSERLRRKDHTGRLIKSFKMFRALRREEVGRDEDADPSSFETGRIFTPLTTATDKVEKREPSQQHTNNRLRFEPLRSVEDALVSNGVTRLVSPGYARGLMHSQTITEFEEQAREMRTR
jgi:hypothetical protein